MKWPDLRERIRRWWNGEFVPHENKPDDYIVFLGGYYKKHWTAQALNAVTHFVENHWKWLAGGAGVLALWIIEKTLF